MVSTCALAPGKLGQSRKTVTWKFWAVKQQDVLSQKQTKTHKNKNRKNIPPKPKQTKYDGVSDNLCKKQAFH